MILCYFCVGYDFYILKCMSSILERVLLSQEMTERQTLSPVDICTQLLKFLSAREAEVLRLRYGLNGESPQTLEAIGKHYAITRERVRQIEHQSIEKVRNAKSFHAIGEGIASLVQHALIRHGHLRRQDVMMADLLSLSGDSPMNKSSLGFIIEQLLTHIVEEVDDRDRHPSWKLKESPLEMYDEMIAAVKSILTDSTQPLDFDKLLARVLGHPAMRARSQDFRKFYTLGDPTDEEQEEVIGRVIKSYCECSRHIQQNPFGEWGLATWQSIRPRRMSDKIYLVLKKHGNPIHFTAITEQINRTRFDHKVAHPPTVHNELILDRRFVLVGRGTYALKEWGYEPGVVADVIAKILARAGRPLSRDEIIDEVGKQRLVKKGTILLALTNRNRFTRLDDGQYALASSAEPARAADDQSTPAPPSVS